MDSNKLYRIVGIIIFLIVLIIVGVSVSKVDFSRNIKKVINSDPKKPEQNEVYNLFEGITTGSIYNSVYQIRLYKCALEFAELQSLRLLESLLQHDNLMLLNAP